MPLIFSLILWLVGYVSYSDMDQSDKSACTLVSVLFVGISLLIIWFKG